MIYKIDGNKVILSANVKSIRYDFHNDFDGSMILVINSNIHVNGKFIPQDNSKEALIYKGYSDDCRKLYFDEIHFSSTNYLNDDILCSIFEYTVLYCPNIDLNNHFSSMVNVQFFIGGIKYGINENQIPSFYKFYLIHKQIIEETIKYFKNSEELQEKIDDFAEKWSKLYFINIDGDYFQFCNTFVYEEYDEEIKILALHNCISEHIPQVDIYIPSRVNNRKVILPFYFHIAPLFDDSKILLKKVTFDGGFSTINTCLFPYHDHSGQANISTIELKEGIKEVISLLNVEEEYTNVDTLIIASSVEKIDEELFNKVKNIIDNRTN